MQYVCFGNALYCLSPADRVSLWAGPVERFVPNGVGAKNKVEKNGAGEIARFYANTGPHYTVEFHKLSLISIVDESLTCKLNAVDSFAVVCNFVFKMQVNVYYFKAIV